MARNRAVESRLERLIPAMDEFYVAGIFSKDDLNEINRTRTSHEYKFIAKPLLPLDIYNAVKYEEEVEARVAEYSRATKVSLKHRWDILDRIESIYRIAMMKIKERSEREKMRKAQANFLKRTQRTASLSRAYAQNLTKYPTDKGLWCEAVEWEMSQASFEAARALVQRALRMTMKNNVDLWGIFLKNELTYAGKLIDQIKRDDDPKKEEALKNNQALATVVLKLGLPTQVVTDSIERKLFNAELAAEFVRVALQFPFTADLVMHVANEALTHCKSDPKALILRATAPHDIHSRRIQSVDDFLFSECVVDAGDKTVAGITLASLFYVALSFPTEYCWDAVARRGADMLKNHRKSRNSFLHECLVKRTTTPESIFGVEPDPVVIQALPQHAVHAQLAGDTPTPLPKSTIRFIDDTLEGTMHSHEHTDITVVADIVHMCGKKSVSLDKKNKALKDGLKQFAGTFEVYKLYQIQAELSTSQQERERVLTSGIVALGRLAADCVDGEDSDVRDAGMEVLGVAYAKAAGAEKALKLVESYPPVPDTLLLVCAAMLARHGDAGAQMARKLFVRLTSRPQCDASVWATYIQFETKRNPTSVQRLTQRAQDAVGAAALQAAMRHAK